MVPSCLPRLQECLLDVSDNPEPQEDPKTTNLYLGGVVRDNILIHT